MLCVDYDRATSWKGHGSPLLGGELPVNQDSMCVRNKPLLCKKALRYGGLSVTVAFVTLVTISSLWLY